jgi:very-short-patch-repair endonuclease
MTSKLTNYAKRLRKDATQAEFLLWSKLRAKQIDCIKFRRQQPIENLEGVLEVIRIKCSR